MLFWQQQRHHGWLFSPCALTMRQHNLVLFSASRKEDFYHGHVQIVGLTLLTIYTDAPTTATSDGKKGSGIMYLDYSMPMYGEGIGGYGQYGGYNRQGAYGYPRSSAYGYNYNSGL